MHSVPRLVLVTDRHATADRPLLDVVAAALDAGLPAVQLREKDLPGGTLYVLAERLRALTARAGALLLVNDRVDVALAVGADGVHLGEGSMPAQVVRGMLPDGALIGVSTHAAGGVASTVVDFTHFGPVYRTPSKDAFGPPQGEEALRRAVRASRAPVIAIGGITASEARAVRAAGAAGAAVIRAILAAGDPAAATRALLDALA